MRLAQSAMCFRPIFWGPTRFVIEDFAQFGMLRNDLTDSLITFIEPTTLWPCVSRASVAREPMNPAAPVTRSSVNLSHRLGEHHAAGACLKQDRMCGRGGLARYFGLNLS
jgi:hypothetical protein